MSDEHDSTSKENSLTILKRMVNGKLQSKPWFVAKKCNLIIVFLAEVRNSNIVTEEKETHMFVAEIPALSTEAIGVIRSTLSMISLILNSDS